MTSPLRIAYFSPLPPARSGIADYSWDLLPVLAERCELTAFALDETALVPDGVSLRPAADFPRARWDFDLALYHMGNSVYHDAIYDWLKRFPGVMVLHDLFLHHLVSERTNGRHDFWAYAREMAYARGLPGLALAREIRAGRAATPLFEEPLNARLVDVSLGVIVHSAYAADHIRRSHPYAPVGVIPQPVVAYAGRSRRSSLGLPADAVLFAHIGQVTAAKQLPMVLRAVAGARQRGQNAHLLIVGEVLPEVDLEAEIDTLGLRQAVTLVGYAPTMQDLVDWIVTADAILNLRQPTLGETSAAALRALAAGRPLIVYDHGWYAEIPDGAALRVPPGDQVALLEAVEALAGSAELRRSIGQAGQAHATTACAPAAVADQIVTFLASLVERYRW